MITLKDFFKRIDNKEFICPYCLKEFTIKKQSEFKMSIAGNVSCNHGDFVFNQSYSYLPYAEVEPGRVLVIFNSNKSLSFSKNYINIGAYGDVEYDCENSDKTFSYFDLKWINDILTFS